MTFKEDDITDCNIRQAIYSLLAFFKDNSWYVRKGNSVSKIEFPKGKNKVRMSAALVSLFDIFVSVDSGMAHIAEAVKTKSIVIYLTVPAWTRSGYYKYTYPIEPDISVWCHPCFDLHRYCWRIEDEVETELSSREKELLKYTKKHASMNALIKKFNTNPEGIQRELSALSGKIEALKCKQPYCSANITNDKILEKIKEIL